MARETQEVEIDRNRGLARRFTLERRAEDAARGVRIRPNWKGVRRLGRNERGAKTKSRDPLPVSRDSIEED